jgi:hypothetical protein
MTPTSAACSRRGDACVAPTTAAHARITPRRRTTRPRPHSNAATSSGDDDVKCGAIHRSPPTDATRRLVGADRRIRPLLEETDAPPERSPLRITSTDGALLYLPACLGGNSRRSYAARMSVNIRLTAGRKVGHSENPCCCSCCRGCSCYDSPRAHWYRCCSTSRRAARALPGAPMRRILDARHTLTIPRKIKNFDSRLRRFSGFKSQKSETRVQKSELSFASLRKSGHSENPCSCPCCRG